MSIIDLEPAVNSDRKSVWARVMSDSMQPFLHPGDLVLIASCPPEKIAPGDLVLYQTMVPCVHRVIGTTCHQGRCSFVTRGDARWYPDPEWSQEKLVGRVERVCSPGGPKAGLPLRGRSRRLGRCVAVLARIELFLGRVLGLFEAGEPPLPWHWRWARLPVRLLVRWQAAVLRKRDFVLPS